MADEIEEIAQRLERAADRYHNAADFRSKNDALIAANQVRRARSAMEAQQIEQAFLRAHPPDGSNPGGGGDLSNNAGCLGGWLGGGRSSGGPWRSTSARPMSGYRPGMIRSYFGSRPYRSYTVHQAIARHAPPGYDPNAYAQSLASAAGIAGGVVLGALTAAQVAALADAIERDPNWQNAPPLGSAAEPGSAYDASSTSRDFEERADDRGRSVSSGTGETGSWADVSSGTDFAGPAAPSDNS